MRYANVVFSDINHSWFEIAYLFCGVSPKAPTQSRVIACYALNLIKEGATKIVISKSVARWSVFLAVVGLCALSVRSGNQSDPDVIPTRSGTWPVTPHAVSVSDKSSIPELDLSSLGVRAYKALSGDAFAATSWQQANEPAQLDAPPPPPPPQAPAIPFAFMGKLVDGATTTVFLMRGDQAHAVRVGDIVDASYQVEDIGEQILTLAYLPLGERQTLAIGSAASLSGDVATAPTVPLPLRGDAAPTHDLGKLVWTAPSEIPIGEEFTIEVGLPAGAEPRSGRLELLYDRLVLALLGGATPQGSQDGAIQRVAVEVIGPGFRGGQPTPSEVRFVVLAGTPTKTQIGIENVVAKLATGPPLAVQSPKAHQLAIVEPPR